MRRSAFLLSLLITITSTSYADDSSSVVKVGAILSLSGGLKQWCQYIQQGMDLAASEKASFPVQIQYEDDQSISQKATLTAFQRLARIDTSTIVFNWTPSTLPVIQKAINDGKIPTVIGSYDRTLLNAGPYVFGAFINYDLVPREIATFLINDQKRRRLALVMATDGWSQKFEEPFRAQVESLGGSYVTSILINPDESDMRPYVLKLKQLGVDGVLAPLFGSPLLALLRESRDLHFEGTIHVGDGMFEEDIKTAGAAAEGVFSQQIWLDSPDLLKKYQSKYGNAVNHLQLGLVGNGYDFVHHIQLLAAELKRTGQPINGESIATLLRTFSSDGYGGRQMYGSGPPSSGEVGVVVRDGRYVPVQ